MSKFVDLQTLPKINSIEVKVNGKKTPLSIGDKIKITEDDIIYKTVVAIQVTEDTQVSYTLEWVEPDGGFKQEIVSLTELKLLSQNSYRRAQIQMISDSSKEV